MKERQLYRETYDRKRTKLRSDCVPILKHLIPPMLVVEAQLIASGVVERDGERLEYQEIRVYVRVEP